MATYDLLDSTTLTSSASSVTFSSLDTVAAGYRDLILVVSGTNATGDQTLRIQINGDTGSNYYSVRMNGSGSTATSNALSAQDNVQLGVFGTTQAVCITQIMDYSATDKHKTLLSRGDIAASSTRATAGRWANTSAITSIYVYGSNSYNFAATFSLYGIAS